MVPFFPFNLYHLSYFLSLSLLSSRDMISHSFIPLGNLQSHITISYFVIFIFLCLHLVFINKVQVYVK